MPSLWSSPSSPHWSPRRARPGRPPADSAWNADRDSLNRLGERWAGATSTAYPNVRDWRTQASALGALLAAT